MAYIDELEGPSIEVLDLSNGEVKNLVRAWQFRHCGFCVARRGVIAIGETGAIRLHDDHDGALLGSITIGEDAVVTSLVSSGDGVRLVCGLSNGKLAVCETLPFGRVVLTVPVPNHQSPIMRLATDKKGDLVAAGSADGWVTVHETKTGNMLPAAGVPESRCPLSCLFSVQKHCSQLVRVSTKRPLAFGSTCVTMSHEYS